MDRTHVSLPKHSLVPEGSSGIYKVSHNRSVYFRLSLPITLTYQLNGNFPNFTIDSLCSTLVKVQFTVTRGGYEAAERRFTAADLEVSVSGRSFIITGANSGIGKAAAYEIAKRGENKTRTMTIAINFYSLITEDLVHSVTFVMTIGRFNKRDTAVTPTGKLCVVRLKATAIQSSFKRFCFSLGGTVHMLCRNKDRAEEARKEIVEQSKNEVNVMLHIFHMRLKWKQ